MLKTTISEVNPTLGEISDQLECLPVRPRAAQPSVRASICNWRGVFLLLRLLVNAKELRITRANWIDRHACSTGLKQINGTL